MAGTPNNHAIRYLAMTICPEKVFAE